MRFRFPVLRNPEIQGNFEQLEEILSQVEKIQFGVAEVTYPGGSVEATPVKVKLQKKLPAAPANSFFLTIFASGVISIPFVAGGSTLSELEIGCITSKGEVPAAGTKQKIFWLIVSST